MTTRPLSMDQALEHVNRVEILANEVDRLYRTTPADRAAIGYTQQHLGIELKLAGVHADLAVAEAITGLRDDLANTDADPMPFGLVERSLAVVHDLDGPRVPDGVTVHPHCCVTDGCEADAVVFPPALCAEHGGLEVRP